LSGREWVFIVVIISIIQAFIWYAAFVNAGNGSALNYVSFAGTIISIILAVLAIGYTYGESISQKNKGDTVANQISTLNEVIKNIKIEAQAIQDISKIQDQFQVILNGMEVGFKNTTDSFSTVSSALLEINNKRASDELSQLPVNTDIRRLYSRPNYSHY
jgi:hypothetical protein